MLRSTHVLNAHYILYSKIMLIFTILFYTVPVLQYKHIFLFLSQLVPVYGTGSLWFKIISPLIKYWETLSSIISEQCKNLGQQFAKFLAV